MELQIDEVQKYINEIPFVKKIHFLKKEGFRILSKVEIAFEELDDTLDFDVEILPQYPLKSYDSESITFKNKELLEYNHVMGNGSICVHTLHSTNLRQKLNIDFIALKNWIIKYYINKDNDLNYEHILVSESLINDNYNAYIFTDVKREFQKGEFGDVKLSYLNNGTYKEKDIYNYFVQSFISSVGIPTNCDWSNIYSNYKITHNGFYVFVENVPAIHNRFILNNWHELTDFLPQDFLKMLHKFEKENIKEFNGTHVPIFIGYNTVEKEIHWQVAAIELGKFPLIGVPEKLNGIKTGNWLSNLTEEKIRWSISRNSSYKYFFGRGTFSKKLTEKKILIIGVGAVGSIIAKTLTRGGCKSIDFVDYDLKEPENVCRSEYMFFSGITNKTDELKNILSGISPFVNIIPLNNNYFETLIKTFHKDKEYKKKFSEDINKYDLIFDCSTDNDLMFVLNSLDLNAEIINMSITNHANELVCAFSPNIYQFVNNQFSNVLENDVDDLYNPIGCWSPTFKASYNDIDTLVQVALKNINFMFEEGKKKNNFIIKSENKLPYELNIIQY